MSDELAAVYRHEVGRYTATLIRAEAFGIAAERWPVTGIPPNPGGWITTTTRNTEPNGAPPWRAVPTPSPPTALRPCA